MAYKMYNKQQKKVTSDEEGRGLSYPAGALFNCIAHRQTHAVD